MEKNDVLNYLKVNKKNEYLQKQTGYNESVKASWAPIWVKNSYENYEIVKNVFSEKPSDLAAVRTEDFSTTPLLILGSGPSLNDLDGLIKEWTGKIMCSTSQLSWLDYQGKKPDYLILLDCDPSMTYLVSRYDFTDVKILTHPQIPKKYFEYFPKENLYFFRMFDPGDQLTATQIPIAYDMIKSHVLNAGCVVNCMSAIAHILGFSPIFYAGYDLGYPDNNYRYTDYLKIDKKLIAELEKDLQTYSASLMQNKNYKAMLESQLADERFKQGWEVIKKDLKFGEKTIIPENEKKIKEIEEKLKLYEKELGDLKFSWLKIPDPGVPATRPNIKKSFNGILADDLCFFYKYSFIVMMGLDLGFRGISCSRGIVAEIPYVHAVEVIKTQGKGYEHLFYTDQERYDIARKYLKHRGMYIRKDNKKIEMRNIDAIKKYKRLFFKLGYWWIWNIIPLIEKIKNKKVKK